MTYWTDERVERLKVLWAQGDSASIIGAELGITRNAAIGKAHRLKLAARPHGGDRTASKTARRTARKYVAKPAPRPVVATPPDTSRLCSLFELTANTCRWPLDGGYCGHHTDKTYCGFHAQMSYRRAA